MKKKVEKKLLWLQLNTVGTFKMFFPDLPFPETVAETQCR